MEKPFEVPINRPNISCNRRYVPPVLKTTCERITEECASKSEETLTLGLVDKNDEVNESAVLEKLESLKNWNMSGDDVRRNHMSHALSPWIPQKIVAENGIVVSKQHGFFIYDSEGREYLDINSLQMNANLGYTPPEEIMSTMIDTMNDHFHAVPTAQMTPMKAKLCLLMDSILPGDLSHFYFSTSGAEANETAIRAARRFTGKSKILSFYRSYHGATQLALSVSGDPRRHFTSPDSAPNVIHLASLQGYVNDWGNTDEERTSRMLSYLEECVISEDPKTIAAFILEPIVGTNGLLIPPPGFLEGVRALCDKHDILMIVDEVMAGFLRTGRWFGFMHTSPMIIPDIVTCAKGINCGWIPFGCVCFRRKLGEHFMTEPVGIGSTYNSHGVGMASCFAVIEYYLKQNIRDHVRKAGAHLKNRLTEIQQKHPCVKEFRLIGLFCFVELRKDASNDSWVLHKDAVAPVLMKVKNAMLDAGIVAFFKGSGFFINPFLNIPVELIDRICDVIDVVLKIGDEEYDR